MIGAARAAMAAERAEPTGIAWGTVRTTTGTGDLTLSAVAPVGAALVLAVARAGAIADTFQVNTAGWAPRHGPVDQGTARRLYIWTARHTGSLATSVTATRTSGTNLWRATLAVVWNADYDTSAAAATANSTSHTIPSVNTTAAGDLGL